MKLMIVDDHAATRSLIREMIGHFADTILECASGEEAALRCAEFQPDLVTMDLNMRMTDGLETTRQILAQYPHSRVIVITQCDTPASRAAAMRAGACHFFAKDNLSRLLQHLQRSQAGRGTGDRPPATIL